MPKFPYHPAATLLPRPTDQERANLKADIEKFGIREPIELYQDSKLDGKTYILDGITRHEIGNELGLDMSSDYITLDDHSISHDPYAYSLSKNLCRRHLSPSQVGMIVAEAEAEHRKFAVAKTPRRLDTAPVAGISARTLESAAAVVKRGAPEVVEAVKAGKLKVSAAEQFVRAEPDKEKQAAAMKAADPKEEVKRRISGGATEKESEGSEAEPDSLAEVQADLKEFESRLRELARFGRQILQANGSEVKRPWCSRYSLLTLIQPLQHVARTVVNDMPVGGTAAEPKLNREELAEKAG